MPRYEFSEGSSNKFWEITLDGSSFTTTWGKIGTAGQSTTKSFDTAAKAQAEHDKLVTEKVKKGYQLAGAATTTAAGTATPKPAPTVKSAPAAKPAPAPKAVPAAPTPAAPTPAAPTPAAPAPAATGVVLDWTKALSAKAAAERAALTGAGSNPVARETALRELRKNTTKLVKNAVQNGLARSSVLRRSRRGSWSSGFSADFTRSSRRALPRQRIHWPRWCWSYLADPPPMPLRSSTGRATGS